MKPNLETIFNVVVGTAGHIDHGKSSLIERLTGVNPDRLPEERSRGLTIDLGFAPLTLKNGLRVGIVDVPGHERLVKNMVAGATGIDAVLLVVAADDGVMPQTREHLAIMELLDLKHGLVVVTKTDLVEKDFLELVRADIEDCLKGTFLREAPVVEFSSVTGEGLDTLVAELHQLLDRIRPRDATGVFRMPIQRVFSSRGFGTVVTGIPVGGQASVGDALEVVPLGKKGRVRGLHAYGEVTDLVRAGHSSAVNITDIDYREVHRGMVLTQPGYFRSATMFEASFHYLPLNRRPLLHQAPVRVHVGTAEILGRVYLLEKKTLDPGEHSFVQFRLEAPLVAAPGDRYVVRAYSPLSTLGGGEILDRSRWRLKTGKGYVIDQLQEKADAVKDLNKFVTTATYSQGYDATTEADLARRVGLPPQELKTCVGELEGTGALCRSGRGGLILSQARLDEARSEVLRFAEQRFNESPRSRYLEQALLRQRLSAHEAFFQHLIQGLQQEGVITDTRDGRLAFRDYGPRLSATEATLKDDLTRALEGGGLSPPSPAELAATNDWSSDVTEELARLLVDEGEIVQLAEGVYLHRRSLEKARSAIQTHLESQGSMTASEAKNLLGSTRKYVIPLLEALDREGFTIRRGDVRELKQT